MELRCIGASVSADGRALRRSLGDVFRQWQRSPTQAVLRCPFGVIVLDLGCSVAPLDSSIRRRHRFWLGKNGAVLSRLVERKGDPIAEESWDGNVFTG